MYPTLQEPSCSVVCLGHGGEQRVRAEPCQEGDFLDAQCCGGPSSESVGTPSWEPLETFLCFFLRHTGHRGLSYSRRARVVAQGFLFSTEVLVPWANGPHLPQPVCHTTRAWGSTWPRSSFKPLTCGFVYVDWKTWGRAGMSGLTQFLPKAL